MKKYLYLTLLLLSLEQWSFAQVNTLVLSADRFDDTGKIILGDTTWLFRLGNNPDWAKPLIDLSKWKTQNPLEISKELTDENGRLECWLRLQIKLDDSFEGIPLGIQMVTWAASDVYIDGELLHSFGHTGRIGAPYRAYNPFRKFPSGVDLSLNQSHTIAIHLVAETSFWNQKLKYATINDFTFLELRDMDLVFEWNERQRVKDAFDTIVLGLDTLLFFLILLIALRVPKENKLYLIVIFLALANFDKLFPYLMLEPYLDYIWHLFYRNMYAYMGILIPISLLITVNQILKYKLDIYLISFITVYILVILSGFYGLIPRAIYLFIYPFILGFFLIYLAYYIIFAWGRLKGATWALIISIVASFVLTIVWILSIAQNAPTLLQDFAQFLRDISLPLGFALYVAFRFQEIFKEEQKQTQKVLNLTQEKQEILENQNKVLEQQVQERTEELQTSLENLKATQSQLIQAEKLASLGELTAGIAHEIQNPLNFVNNFSEVSQELVDEMQEEIEKDDKEEVKAISQDLKGNLEKINHHGKRADAIVKGMLEHSRVSTGEKTPTDLNALADEYLRLSYHGLRAKDKSFNADFEAILDENLPKVNIVSQDIGRVLLNLINNAFYAVHQKAQTGIEDYQPKVIVQTKALENEVEITVKDNGTGIPDSVKEKIFQPFFTTKPTGQGTGLGLSLSYDIIKAHGGKLKVESQADHSTEFFVSLPKA